MQSLPTLKTGRSHLGPACFGVLDVSLLLPKAEVHFTVLIDLNVHGLDVAGIELILFTGGHVRPGHFLNLSEDFPDVEVHLFLQALTQFLQQGPLLDLVAVAGAEIVQIAVGDARILKSVPNGTTDLFFLHKNQEPRLFQRGDQAPVIGIGGGQDEGVDLILIELLAHPNGKPDNFLRKMFMHTVLQ